LGDESLKQGLSRCVDIKVRRVAWTAQFITSPFQ
jgi:hypothetical protein